jgi:predicted TIM-barrel fold metal-dependent hydrolase
VKLNAERTQQSELIADRIQVVDVDSHVMEPVDLWTSRIDGERWGDLVPHVRRDEKAGIDRWWIGKRRGSAVANFAVANWKEFPPSFPGLVEEADPAAWDPHQRLERLTEVGIHQQVLYPNILGFSSVYFFDLDPELRYRCVAAYNDYITDFCSADPNRLIGLMWLPFWDLELAVKELERCVRNGHHGVIFPSNFEPIGMPPVYDEHWDPIWEAAQHHQMSINFHTGFQISEEEARSAIGYRRSRADFAKMSSMFLMGNARTVADLTLYGVCHRFPRVNFVSVESGFGWMPYFAEMLDWQWLNSGARDAYPEMLLLPSEYIRRQIYGTFWFESEPVRRMGDQWADNLMFETDFPHPTAIQSGPASYSDNPKQHLEKSMAGVADEVLTKILRDNAARVYHLD